MLGCFNGRELELDDDVVLVGYRLVNPLRRHPRVSPCLGEPREGTEPSGKV